MLKKQKIGHWTLLDSESAPKFLRYAILLNKEYDDYAIKFHEQIFKKLILPNLENNKKRTAIDIGSSYGFFSFGLAHQFDAVKSFEVVHHVRECCVENLRDCKNVTVFDCGLSSSVGNININFFPEYSGHSSINLPDLGNQKSHKTPCTVVPLDLFKFNDVDFIKIDVEGSELEVLRGASETIKNNSPLILIELLDSQKNAEQNIIMVTTFLEELGYSLKQKFHEDYLFTKEL
jgi:FkbM family methyltransferase